MKRVLPRDAFNDANLLKCIAHLTMLIEDGKIQLRYEYDSKPFDIQQDWTSGATFVANVKFFDRNGKPLAHYRPLNSRYAWPLILLCTDADGKDQEFYAFGEDGNFLPDHL